MKTLIFTVFIVASALAQLPAPPSAALPKRPLGVPADAKPFNGRWYKVVLEKKSWHAARDKCKEMGGQLVTIPDAATWEFVKGLTGGAKLWIGATDEVTEGKWVWIDGSPLTFTDWAPGEPNNFGAAEHYLAVNGKQWNDLPKQYAINNSVVVGFLCEWGSTRAVSQR